MNPDCIFCRIVAGTLPSTPIYEDAETLAFLDIGPVVKGHTLVIPKAHFDPLPALPLPLLQKVIGVVQKIARAQIVALKADGINISQANGEVAGQVIPHVHFHIIPRFTSDGIHRNWIPREYTDRTEMKTFADRIIAALE
jgi:histidine triad (HIT) family protein